MFKNIHECLDSNKTRRTFAQNSNSMKFLRQNRVASLLGATKKSRQARTKPQYISMQHSAAVEALHVLRGKVEAELRLTLKENTISAKDSDGAMHDYLPMTLRTLIAEKVGVNPFPSVVFNAIKNGLLDAHREEIVTEYLLGLDIDVRRYLSTVKGYKHPHPNNGE
jgi:hypothetical protein